MADLVAPIHFLASAQRPCCALSYRRPTGLSPPWQFHLLLFSSFPPVIYHDTLLIKVLPSSCWNPVFICIRHFNVFWLSVLDEHLAHPPTCRCLVQCFRPIPLQLVAVALALPKPPPVTLISKMDATIRRIPAAITTYEPSEIAFQFPRSLRLLWSHPQQMF